MGGGILGAIIYAAITAAVSTAATFISMALAPKPRKPKAPSSRVTDYRTLARDNNAPARIIYGTMRVSGVLAFAMSTDAGGTEVNGGQYLHMIVLLSEGPVSKIYDIYLNDKPYTDEMYFTNSTYSSGQHRVGMVSMNGWDNQPAYPKDFIIGSAPGGYVTRPTTDFEGNPVLTDAHRFRGIAYVGMCLHHERVMFAGGRIVKIRAVMNVKVGYLF